MPWLSLEEIREASAHGPTPQFQAQIRQLHVSLLNQACSVGGLGSTLALQGPDTIVGLLRCGLTYVLSGDRIVGMCNTMRAAFFTNSKLLPRRLSKRRSE